MDIRQLTFEDSSFDVCVDKATLDAMLYGSLWDPPDEVKVNVKSYVDEVARVLKPGGKWLYVTWRQPHFIRPFISREGVWNMEVETLSDGAGMFEYFGSFLNEDVKLNSCRTVVATQTTWCRSRQYGDQLLHSATISFGTNGCRMFSSVSSGTQSKTPCTVSIGCPLYRART
jgi:SAM-dependent methyltransferase